MFAKSIHRTTLDGPLQGAKRMRLPFKPTPEHPLIISASEIGSFLRCRLQWSWSYRVGLQAKVFGPPRDIGLIVHIGKETWYTLPHKKRTVDRMLKIATNVSNMKELKLDAKNRALAKAMLIGYAEWALDDHEQSDKAIGKREVYPEDPFVLPLTKDGSILVRGRIDERFEPTIYRGVLAMDETKTRTSVNFDMLDLSYQMTTYLWAMQQKFPRDERGRRYKRYLAWRTVLRRQMPGPRVSAPLFGRESVERDPDELRMWLIDIRRTVTDMLDAAIYPNMTDQCKWGCDFYKLCLVRSNKSDLKEIIQTEYTAK
jgi:hypothetical protein